MGFCVVGRDLSVGSLTVISRRVRLNEDVCCFDINTVSPGTGSRTRFVRGRSRGGTH
jgi:hypothetical protein